MIKKLAKNRNKIFQRIITTMTAIAMTIALSLSNIPVMPVYATGAEFVGVGIAEAVGSGAMASGMVAGSGLGSVLGVVGIAADFFSLVSNSGKKGNINTYYYQGGDTYNTTVNYKVFNDYTKNTTVTSNYNYSFYNPVTNNYNYTNDYSYNPHYNTYYYQTKNGDTNTSYYITDNTTNISYYIVNSNESTNEKFESYYEIYYKLPDGRNSYNLKKEDIWGQYLLYKYSKYQSVAEDDGRTLGLWHLNGNLKDSSYWGNSSGSSTTSTYKTATYDGGKYLGNSADYFLLKLDKVTLPSSWTLEWIQYVPRKTKSSITTTDRNDFLRRETKSEPIFVAGVPPYTTDLGIVGQKEDYYNRYETRTYYTYSGASGFPNENFMLYPKYDTFERYAIVKNGNSYTYYINGVKNTIITSSNIKGSGIEVTSLGVKFFTGSRSNKPTTYELSTTNNYGSVIKGIAPTSSNFQDKNYDITERFNLYYRNEDVTLFNYDSIIDEVRLSKGAIYSGNYTPSTQPYTTNMVLVVPNNPSENEIAFKTNYNLGNVRVGGARPTYPATGQIFVNLTNNKVDSIQQYQETGWYDITGAIYRNGKWTDLKGFDMSEYMVIEPEVPDNPDPDNPDPDNPDPDNPDPDNPDPDNPDPDNPDPDNPDPDNPDPDNPDPDNPDPDNPDPDNPDPDNPDPDNPDPDNPDPDNPVDKESIWDKLGKLLASLFGIIEKLISPLIDGVISLINTIMEALGALTNLSEGFSSFLKATFLFIPEDILSIIGLGVMLTIFASIIKIFM